MPTPVDRDPSWFDRAVPGWRSVSFDPDQLRAEHAAAAIAFGGPLVLPTTEPATYKPGRPAEIAFPAMLAALDTGRGSQLVDEVDAVLEAISTPDVHWRLRLWGAYELLARGDRVRAERWVRWIPDVRYRDEYLGHELARRAQHGDVRGALDAIDRLPAEWALMSDMEYWAGYPRWLGSVAAAACAALAYRGVSADAGRALVERAEQRTLEHDGEDWRANREQRALAFAWARLGDLERAWTAIGRMPGSERSKAISDLLDEVATSTTTDLAQLRDLARRALGTPEPDAAEGDRSEDIHDFIETAMAGDVNFALVRAYLRRGDVAAAEATFDTIPSNLSVCYEAALVLECARLARGETTLDEVLGVVPGEHYRANLVGAAMHAGCAPVIAPLLRGVRYPERIAANHLNAMLAAWQLGPALTMVQALRDVLSSGDRGELQLRLVRALVAAGQPLAALDVMRQLPPIEYPYPERMAVCAGFTAVVALVAAGHIAEAHALHADVAARLARVGFEDP
ncbi:MAG TPA: hypothetical protein VFQ53_36415 [Kofleriaceae bacterium]|nr:hypothetical protein [Kofleriaceae bacterium]